MKWSDVLNETREKLTALRSGVALVNDYWDRKGLAADAKEQIGKHVPAELQSLADELVDRVDRMLDALTDPAVDDSDTVPDAPAQG